MYSEQMNDIMSSVEFFNGVYGKPMSNGINFNTNNFKENFSIEDFSIHYKTNNPQAYAYYQSIVEKIYNFKSALEEYVAQDNFIETWNSLTSREKNYIVYFDSDSYITLRSKLSSHDIMPIDWEGMVKNASFQWNESSMKILGMPEELYTPPVNKLQLFKQKKALLNIGYSEEDVAKIEPLSNMDAMKQNLFIMVIEKRPKKELPDILNSLNIHWSGWSFYTIDFIQEQEEKLQKRAKPRM